MVGACPKARPLSLVETTGSPPVHDDAPGLSLTGHAKDWLRNKGDIRPAIVIASI